MRIYLDTAPVIYLVQYVEPYLDYLTHRLTEDNTVQVCGELTRMEARIKPVRSNDAILLKAFDDYFADIIEEIVPLSRSVVDEATELRVKYNFRIPDALQLASAIAGNCDLFLTNDAQLLRCAEIRVETIPQ